MRKLLAKKRLSIPLGLVLAWLAFGFFAVGPIVRHEVLTRVPPLLHHRPLALAEAHFNPLKLALTLRGLEVKDHDGSTLLAFDELLVDLAGTELARGVIGFDEVRLEHPVVGVSLLKDGQLSIADLLAEEPTTPAPQHTEKKKLPVIHLARLSVQDGAVAFTDGSRPTPYHASVRPLAFTLSDFSTEPGADSAYRFNARLGTTQLRWDGDLVVSPVRSKGQFSIEGFELKSLAPYLEDRTQLKLADGRLNLTAHYSLEGTALAVESAVLTLAGLQVKAPMRPEPLVTLGQLVVRAQRIDLAKHDVALEAITLDQGALQVRSLADGTLELTALAGPPPGKAPAAAPATTTTDEAPASPWHVSLPKLALEHLALTWEDGSKETPATVPLTDVGLEVTGAEWPLTKPVGLRLGAKLVGGSLEVDGPVGLKPLTAQLNVKVDQLPLGPLWPYARSSVDLALTGGAVSFQGNVGLAGDAVKLGGDLHLDGLGLEDPDGAPLFSAQRLELGHLAVTTSPLVVELGTVALTTAKLSAVLDEHASPVAMKLLRSRPAAPVTTPTPVAATPGRFKVAELRLDDSRVDVVDRSVTPAGTLSLQQVKVRVRNLTHPTRSLMPVEVTAKVDGAPFSMKGTVKPAGADSIADLTIALGGYELPLTTPYSVKYVAQPIQKGKLSLDLKWKVGGHRLDAQNRVRVDQLDFGDAVEHPGPDASRLPLGLAVAILSDRTGLIDLDLPMEGDLSDPQFGWLKVVVTTLKNLLEKVATAPFSLLSGLFSGDPEAMKTVAFTPGEAAPAVSEASKLQSLSSVLTSRPALHVAVTPFVSPEVDGPALTRLQLRSALATKLGVDGGVYGLDDAAWQRWVADTWRALHPDAGVPEGAVAEAAVLSARAVGPAELEALRKDRAAAVVAVLSDGGVDAARVFLTLEGDGSKAGQPAASVELKTR